MYVDNNNDQPSCAVINMLLLGCWFHLFIGVSVLVSSALRSFNWGAVWSEQATSIHCLATVLNGAEALISLVERMDFTLTKHTGWMVSVCVCVFVFLCVCLCLCVCVMLGVSSVTLSGLGFTQCFSHFNLACTLTLM